MIENNKIILGDSLEVLKNLPDRSVDLVILDPPYWKVVGQKWDYQWRTLEDYNKWCLCWIKEVSRVIKLSGCVFLFGYIRNLFEIQKYFLDYNFEFRQQIVINKGMRSVSGRATKNYKMFPNVTESILFFNYNSKPFIKNFLKEKQAKSGLKAKEINDLLGVKSNGGGLWSLYTGNNILAQVPTKEMWEKLEEILNFKLNYSDISFTYNAQMGLTDVWDDINFYSEKRTHPTQKPIMLIERLIKATTKEGDLVLDPFLGTGSTAMASIRLNRNYIGIEKEKKYFDFAKNRISEEINATEDKKAKIISLFSTQQEMVL